MRRATIVIVGHFAHNLPVGDGQSIKTRMVYVALCDKFGKDAVDTIDTHGWKKNPLKLLFGILKRMNHTKHFIILPAINGIGIFGPLFVMLRKYGNYKIHYIVIGAWLNNYLNTHPRIAKKIAKFDYIYVETSKLQKILVSKGYNAHLMYNFKLMDSISNTDPKTNLELPLKLCTFSRVNMKKGIEEAVETVEKINRQVGKTVFTLDIYGKIDSDYSERFSDILNKNSQNINYRGVIDYDKTTAVLSKYYLMLFPTKFYTEGIPGSLIDSFAAGLPVLASRWENFNDVIVEGKNGYGYIFDDVEDFHKQLASCAEQSKVNHLRKICLETSKIYTTTEAINPLKTNIEKSE
jgi:glycosyltransferase involved in cell wall biosynthesis